MSFITSSVLVHVLPILSPLRPTSSILQHRNRPAHNARPRRIHRKRRRTFLQPAIHTTVDIVRMLEIRPYRHGLAIFIADPAAVRAARIYALL
jgi:hypothetical protein